MRRIAQRSLSAVAVALAAPLFGFAQAPAGPGPQPKPNIVMIMLDDLDVQDINSYVCSPMFTNVGNFGCGDITTDNIDSLAGTGMRFTQYYAGGPVCTPTRATITTGHYANHLGFKRALRSNSQRGIPGDVTTLAEMLQGAGYHTGHVGKWHMGRLRPEHLPTNSGFERSWRRESSGGYLDFAILIDDTGPAVVFPGEHLTETLTDFAIQFVNEAPSVQPFFLQLWYLAPHLPLEPPVNFPYGLYGYDQNTDRGKFAALVTNADLQIERLLDELINLNLLDNTIIILASDNGGARPTHIGLPRLFRGFKQEVFEGGIRVPMIINWPSFMQTNMTSGTVHEGVVTALDFYPTLAEIAGADVSEQDLRGQSLMSVLETNQPRARQGPMFWENKFSNFSIDPPSGISNSFAVRNGDWKMTFTNENLQLFDMSTDLTESNDLSDVHPGISDFLRLQYDLWRHEVGDIAYDPPTLSASGASLAGTQASLSGGTVTIPFDSRFDFHDGNFTFTTLIAPDDIVGPAMIAQKAASWKLFVAGRRVRLEVQNDLTVEIEMLQSANDLVPGVPVHVAFTIYDYRFDGSTIALYLDGQQVDRVLPSVIDAVNLSNGPILIGNDTTGTMPFTGTIELPRLSLLSLYPTEVLEDFEESMFGVRSPRPFRQGGIRSRSDF